MSVTLLSQSEQPL